MTTTRVDLVYLLCQTGPNTGNPHDLAYRGKTVQSYLCKRCGWTVSKADLKANTD